MRLRMLLLCSLLLSGCAAAAAISAIPGLFVDRAVGFFSGQDASLAVGMQRSLAAVQQGLERMSLHVNVLEPVPGGYAMEFGNGELDGDIHLKRQTQKLTTMTISAHSGLSHEASVEAAMVKEVRSASEQAADDASFDFSGYERIYAKPDMQAGKLGWFRPGAKLHVSQESKDGWLKIKLPSGQAAYIKGAVKGDGV